MNEPLVVPVRVSAVGSVVVMTGRLERGRERVGLAFSSVEGLRAALGDSQDWIRLAEPALRAMLRPMGVMRIQVDALFVGAEVPVVRVKISA